MKLYTRVDTIKRREKFKNVVRKYNIEWFSGSTVDEYFPSLDYYDYEHDKLAVVITTTDKDIVHIGFSEAKGKLDYHHVRLSRLDDILRGVL